MNTPEQGALRHQLAQRLERGETDEEDPLLSRYQGFLAAESSLTVPTDPGLASLQLLFDEREQLRRQHFSPTEQASLFAEDRLMEQWTLRRKALAEADDADTVVSGGRGQWPPARRSAAPGADLPRRAGRRAAGATGTGGGGSAAPAGAEPARVRTAVGGLSGGTRATATPGSCRTATDDPGALVRSRTVAAGRGSHPDKAGGASIRMRRGPQWAPLAGSFIAAC